ncbi:MAG: AarF/UbiB family protein [Alcanivorax sp.]|nr:AarF/UbiB family protein [Alcanivorax sp.]
MTEQPQTLGQTTRMLWNARGRYKRVATTAASLRKVMWKHRKLLAGGDEAQRLPLHQEVAESLATLFRDNGGAWIKFAQFLSCRPDLLPAPYIDAFAHLRENAPKAHFDDIQPWLKAQLGHDWADSFSAFNIIPVAAASIAQVHNATLANGDVVAVKLQQPRVSQEFSEDATALRLLARALKPLLREVDLEQVINQLIATTERELDFRLEMANMQAFGELPHLPGIKVPKVYPQLCSAQMLVTEWIEGQSLSSLLASDEEAARPLLERLQDSMMQQVLQFGLFHADPHPGNFIVTPDGDLAVLDFGAMEQVAPQARQHYTALLMRLLGMGDGPLLPLFEAAGFGGLNEERLEKLSAALVSARHSDATLADNLRTLLDEFRRLRLVIPDPFVAMVRVLITVGGLMTRYHIPFRWSGLSR